MTSIAVFLGSSRGTSPTLAHAARTTGTALARRGWRLIYGGAHRGLMGELADAALAAGGEVYGVLPRDLEARELAHRGLTRLDLVDSMAARKDRMMALADGFLTLPGGYGTLDELFEVLTAAQLGHHAKPTALWSLDGYYAPLAAWIDGAVATGMLAPAYRDLVSVHAELDDALAALAPR
ncbi:MAG: TIGR00730 family Rossman fold protein [Kofleriaceae bacterium]